MEVKEFDEGPTLSLRDLLEIVRHRYLWLTLPAVLISVIGAAIAVSLPPVYRSSATILVESQQIPKALVQSMVTSYADERIQIIRQRVMTRANLLRVIEKFGLYADENLSVTEMINSVRDSVFVETISSKQGAQIATIAFTVAFEHRSAATAQKIANELVTLFLSENAEARTKRATETTEFLAQEAEKLNGRIRSIEQQIADYKRNFHDSLPENLGLNMGALERARGDLRELDRDMKATQEQKSFFEVELSTLRSSSVQTAGNQGVSVLSPAEQLVSLQTELALKEVELTSSHPEIKGLKLRIAGLQTQLELSEVREEVELGLDIAIQELGRLQAQFTDKHPAVKIQQAHVDKLAARVKALPQTPPENVKKLPGYREIEARIQAMDGRLIVFAEQRERLLEKVENLEQRIEKTPQVERGFKSLARDYENASSKYREVRNKQMEAQLAQNLEEDRKAERFSLLEPAAYPEQAQKPNRIIIVALGLMLGMGTGGSAVYLAELMDKSIRSQEQLNALLDEPILVSIPLIIRPIDELRSKKRKRVMVATTLLGLLLAVLAVHYFYRPIDELLFAVQHRFGLH